MDCAIAVAAEFEIFTFLATLVTANFVTATTAMRLLTSQGSHIRSTTTPAIVVHFVSYWYADVGVVLCKPNLIFCLFRLSSGFFVRCIETCSGYFAFNHLNLYDCVTHAVQTQVHCGRGWLNEERKK